MPKKIIKLTLFNRKKGLRVFFILIFSIILRCTISKIGFTYDLESFHIIGELMSKGKNIYAETFRYNYSPFWAILLTFFKWVSYFFDNNQLIFRFLIILILSLADIAIAFWLWNQYNFYLSLIFLFNPLSIYITGFHNQFDNLAIALALWSSIFLIKNNQRDKLFGYLLLSLSIIIKHIFVFILPWLFFQAKSKKEKFLSFLPVMIFLISFLPFSFSKNALKGIWINVFTYQSASNIYPFFSFKGIWRPIILLGLISFFYLFVKKQKLSKQFALYLLLITGLSPIAASQYLVIPIVGHLVINPLVGILYIILASRFIFFKIYNFSNFVIPIFQFSWLSFIINFFPFLLKKLKILIIGLIIFFTMLYSFALVRDIKKIYQEQWKEILIMRVFYPVKQVFRHQQNLLKKPLTKNLVLEGEFVAKENNLGFIAIPFQLENPSGEEFFKKNYQIGATITQIGDKRVSYTEIRNINIALTQDGIILGFPIQNQSKGRKYKITVFSTIPEGKDYVLIDRHQNFQARYFLTKRMLKEPLVLFPFFCHKIKYFFSLKSSWVFLFKFYFVIGIIFSLILYKV